MEENKPVYKSKTVWGVLVTLFAIALRFKGIEIEGADKQLIVDNILQLIEVGGAAFAIYGRVAAKTNLVIKK